jgi:hypothetical protein
MTNEQINELANEALNAAAALIQKRLGVTDGGHAAIFFSDDVALNNLVDYIASEIDKAS